MHANIHVHRRIFISDFPGDGVNGIAKIQSHCTNTTFGEKVGMTGFFNKSHIKEGSLQLIILKDSKMHRLCLFQYETITQRIK